jgi:uncharacterized CHY-type Zn-finger protein
MKTHRTVEIFRTSKMPSDGWFQACLHCHQITSKHHYYKTVTHYNSIIEYVVFLCPDCQKKITNISFKENLYKQCEKRINNYLRTRGSKSSTTPPRPIKPLNNSYLKRR